MGVVVIEPSGLAGGISRVPVIAVVVPAQTRKPAKSSDGGGLYDFRPVLKNRSAMAYALAYCVHTLGMSALRGWGVAFLAYVAGSTGNKEAVISPAVMVTALGLIGTFASLFGNEMAIRLGRRRLVQSAMFAPILLGGTIGFLGTTSYTIAAGLMLFYGFVIWLDSSSLTAGAAGTAEPSRRGATLAVHSTLGYAGGFVGPLMMGWTLRPQRRHVHLRLGHLVRRRRRADVPRLDRLLVDQTARTRGWSRELMRVLAVGHFHQRSGEDAASGSTQSTRSDVRYRGANGSATKYFFALQSAC